MSETRRRLAAWIPGVAAAPSDAELATAALAGSEEACRALVERYAAAAVNLAARLVRDRALAEDLAQEAFVRAFSRLESYDRGRRFSSWFFQVVHNVAVDYLRRRRPETVSLDGAADTGAFAAASASPSPAELAEHAALGRALTRALDQLRPEYREALVLHYRLGLTHAEVGTVMGMPVGTVKTCLYRGRIEMAALLTAEGWGPAASAGLETRGPESP